MTSISTPPLSTPSRSLRRSRDLDPEVVSVLAHRDLPVQAPLDATEVLDLVRRLDLPPAARVVDAGCGTGGWIQRVVKAHPDARVRGYDTSDPALLTARTRLAEPIKGGAVTLANADVSLLDLDRFADLVLCVGSSHAFGGAPEALTRLRRWVVDRGQVVYGDLFWTYDEPTEEALAAYPGGESLPRGLDALRATARQAGFRIQLEQVSSLSAWDRYEAGWVAGLDRAAEAVTDPITGVQLLTIAELHERAYEDGYRGQLGFAVFILQPV